MSDLENKAPEVTVEVPFVEAQVVESAAIEAKKGPVSDEEIRKNQEEEDRKTMRVIQIVQHDKGGRIEVYPVQNIRFRSDIIGVLVQALNNIQNEDVMRNSAALLRESINLIKSDQAPKS